LMQVTGIDESEANEKLEQAGGLVKLAILMTLSGKNAEKAQNTLDNANGFLRKALDD